MSRWREIIGAAAHGIGPQYSQKPQYSADENISGVCGDSGDGISGPDSNADSFEERAALVEYGAGVPHDWADGFARLAVMPRPAAYSPDRWHQIIDDAGRFLDCWAEDAARLGWDAASVFGVGSTASEARTDQKGVVALIRGWKVTGVAVDRVTVRNPKTDNTLSIYRRADAAGRVMLWEIDHGRAA